MKATWSLSAVPVPTMASLILRGANSATGTPAMESAAMAAPRAWPSFSAERGLALTSVSSTPEACGP